MQFVFLLWLMTWFYCLIAMIFIGKLAAHKRKHVSFQKFHILMEVKK